MNIADLFRAPASDDSWLRSAIESLPVPTTLKERNVHQLMLAERYQRQFGGTRLQALQRLATAYANHFPH